MINDWTTPVQRVDVCLVLMPYAAVERPSIALSILKSVLVRDGIGASVVYGNLLFAEEIGVYAHDIVGKSQSHSLAGEWTFASAAFPGFEPDPDAYFAHIGRGLEALLPLVRRQGGRGALRPILAGIRKRTPEFIDRLARRILDARPRIVGCSSTFQQHCASLALLRRIKALDPNVVTVIGGANCESTMGLATHRECPWVDYVVSGEGEDVFRDLCRRVLGAPEAGTAPDRSVAEPIGPRHRAERYASFFAAGVPRARIDDMTRSPMPDYSDYFHHLRERPVGCYVNPGLLIETSRGCWWGEVSHCTFCGLNGTSMGFRSKSPGQVVDEFTTLSERWGLRTFEVVDNILDMAYFKSVVPMLAERQDGYDVFCETKSNLSREHLRRLSAAGIRWLQPGIESFDDGVLRAIAKGTSARQNLQLLKWAQDYGIYVLWILLYDIPGEDDGAYGKMAQWLPLIEHLQPPSGISFIQFNRFSPYHTRPKDFGLTLSPDRAYGFVYPWEARSIDEFAYFFDDYTMERDHIEGLGGAPKRKGLAAAHRAVAQWQLSWRSLMDAGPPSAEVPRLIRTAAGGRIVVTDTRSCRVGERFVLEGLAAEVYEACDRAQSDETLRRTLASRPDGPPAWCDVEAALAELRAQRIMLALDGWYFSLATDAPLPQPNIAHYPGGRLRTFLEAQAAEAKRQAEHHFGCVATAGER
jgi:ribosomal peptide maturation radical SAM protein 1